MVKRNAAQLPVRQPPEEPSPGDDTEDLHVAAGGSEGEGGPDARFVALDDDEEGSSNFASDSEGEGDGADEDGWDEDEEGSEDDDDDGAEYGFGAVGPGPGEGDGEVDEIHDAMVDYMNAVAVKLKHWVAVKEAAGKLDTESMDSRQQR